MLKRFRELAIGTPQTALGILTAAMLGVGLAAPAGAFEAEPGSVGNTIHVQVDDRTGLTSGLQIRAEVLSAPSWIHVTRIDAQGGRSAGLDIAFDVAAVSYGSKGHVKVRLHGTDSSGSELVTADHAITVAVNADVDDVQRSFGIDECCVEVVGVDDLATPPASAVLLGNTPNPFRSLTHVVFGLPVAGGVATLDVFDIQGRLVRTLVSPRLSGGFHRITWDGRDEFGRELSAGTYFYRVSSGTWVETRKLQILE